MRLIDADKLKAHYSWWNDDQKDIFDSIVDSQPTVEVVKHGRWMGTVCSACGESFSEYYDCKFCPNCGARMDGESNE